MRPISNQDFFFVVGSIFTGHIGGIHTHFLAVSVENKGHSASE